MKKNVTKKEMEMAIESIKSTCIDLKENNNDPFERGFKCCCEIILEKIERLENGRYKLFI